MCTLQCALCIVKGTDVQGRILAAHQCAAFIVQCAVCCVLSSVQQCLHISADVQGNIASYRASVQLIMCSMRCSASCRDAQCIASCSASVCNEQCAVCLSHISKDVQGRIAFCFASVLAVYCAQMCRDALVLALHQCNPFLAAVHHTLLCAMECNGKVHQNNLDKKHSVFISVYRTSAGRKVSRNFLAEKGGTPPPLADDGSPKIRRKRRFLP